jgi:sporulation-control protein
MFDKILASIGFGSAKIDTVIENKDIYIGDTIKGKINIQGGSTAQDICGISLALNTLVEVESDDGEYKTGHTIDSWSILDKFTINPNEKISYDFEIHIHNETPVTAINCQTSSKVWLDTNLDINNGIDSQDKDYLTIFPTNHMELFINAMDILGFYLHSYDTEKGYLNGGYFKSVSGCYQEFEFKPKSFNAINEIEASFIIENDKTHVLIELDRRFRGDNYMAITIFRNDNIDTIVQKINNLL